MRLKAAAIRQLDASRFVASDALVTTSRLEEPAYSFESQTITLTDRQQPLVDPYTGMAGVNPATGEPAYRAPVQRREPAATFCTCRACRCSTGRRSPPTSRSRRSTSTTSASGTTRSSASRRSSSSTRSNCSASKRRRASSGISNLDYLSQRGLGFGTSVEYDRDSFFGLAGPTTGRADAWFISDHGLDNLGLGRRDIVPEEKFRGRAFWNHRQKLVGGWLDDWTVQGEVGWLSDRTFLEEYYENEWDKNKDQLTGVRLKRVFDNQSLSIEANGRINDFFTQTQWLPRGDHYWLGESLFDDQTTLYSHTSAAYANIGIATPPTNPTLLCANGRCCRGKSTASAIRSTPRASGSSRGNEIDYPLDFAPFKVVPYALGEFGHWGADLNGNDIQRLWGQVGVRASIPFWAVDPTVRDPLFNLNGLAHKVVFDAEASYADANQNFTEFPLYDELDDDVDRRVPPPAVLLAGRAARALAGSVQSEVRSALLGDPLRHAGRRDGPLDGNRRRPDGRARSACGTGCRRSAAHRARSGSSIG